MRRRCPVRQGRSLASARDRPPFCSVFRDALRGAALRAVAGRSPIVLSRPPFTRPQRGGSPFCERPVAAALRAPPPQQPRLDPRSATPRSLQRADHPYPSQLTPSLFSACPIGHYGRPPGPSDRRPGSIPPGAASPRPAPRSPLRGLRRPGDDPWRTPLSDARCALRLPVQTARPRPSAAVARSLRSRRRRLPPTPRRAASRRVAPPPLPPLSPPFDGSPATPTSQQARRLRAIAVARGLSRYRPVRMTATAHRSSSDIALPRPAPRAMALKTGRRLPPKPWHSPRTSPPCVPAPWIGLRNPALASPSDMVSSLAMEGTEVATSTHLCTKVRVSEMNNAC